MVDNFGGVVELANQLEYLPFVAFFALPIGQFFLYVSQLVQCKPASILLESRIIPKKGREVAGPSTFSNAKGTPSFSHVLVMMFKFHLQISEVGGLMVKKLSK